MAPNTPEEWTAYLRMCLDANQLMVLATAGEDGLWVCPVFFAYDTSFNLFFISKPASRHMRNIEQENSVACAVFDATQRPAGKVRGVQIAGRAHMVDVDEARHAFDIYFSPTHARTPVAPRGGALNYVRPTAEWRLVKISPDHIECFDEHHFSDGKTNVPVEIFKSV